MNIYEAVVVQSRYNCTCIKNNVIRSLNSTVVREINYVKSQDSVVYDWLTLRVSHFKRQKLRMESNESKKARESPVRSPRLIFLLNNRFLIGGNSLGGPGCARYTVNL